MPVTVHDLFEKVGLTPSKPLKWGTPLENNGNGVYVISLSDNSKKNNGIEKTFRIKAEVHKDWIVRSPDLNINNSQSLKDIEKEIGQFWKPNENIIYIGESSSITNGLGKRINQFYVHKVGGKGPHTGGYWTKLISKFDQLYIYYAECKNPRDTEFKMLMHFIEKTTNKNFYELDELGIHLPFANLKVDFQKKHRIKYAVPKKKKKEV
jgi:hypothetical protein